MGKKQSAGSRQQSPRLAFYVGKFCLSENSIVGGAYIPSKFKAIARPPPKKIKNNLNKELAPWT